jgi:hypothetical protein
MAEHRLKLCWSQGPPSTELEGVRYTMIDPLKTVVEQPKLRSIPTRNINRERVQETFPAVSNGPSIGHIFDFLSGSDHHATRTDD